MATLESPQHLDDTLLAAMNVTREFLAHYRREHNHQRLDNQLISSL